MPLEPPNESFRSRASIDSIGLDRSKVKCFTFIISDSSLIPRVRESQQDVVYWCHIGIEAPYIE